MSLYKDASLVMIPSAYKDGKLYSIRPTDGSGDFTFSRGSNLAATRVDVNGLIEKGRENRVLYSNDFTNAAWIKFYTGVTAGQEDPFGGTNGTRLVSTGIGGYIYQNGVCISSSRMTASFWVKSNTGINQDFVFTANSGNQSSSAITATTSWQRVSFTFSSSSSGDILFGYQTTQLVDLLIYGFQLELGLVATDYIETGASTAQAGILEDMPRLDYSGGASCPALLLEPQRTNTISNSEYFGDSSWNNSNQVTRSISNTSSPEGKLNAYDIIPTTSNTNHTLRAPNLSGFTSGAVVNVSFFAKANGYKFISVVGGFGSSSTPAVVFNLDEGTITSGTGTIEDYGNGWYRCITPITLTATALYCVGTILDDNQSGSFAGDGVSGIQAYGWQIEEGSYPTSYIPTYGSSVTRSYDNSSLGGLQTSSILNGTKGTLLFEGIKKQDWYFSNFVITTDGSNTNRSLLIDNSGSVIRLRVWNASSSIDATIFTTSLSNGTFKYLIRWDNGNLAVFVNGASVGSATINAYSYTTINLKEGTFSNNLVNQVLTFPTALTDSECIALTTL